MQSSHDETGARFSHVYLQSTELLPDSERARVRVAELLRVNNDRTRFIGQEIQRELGVKTPYDDGRYRIRAFIENCALQDFLDFFSIIAKQNNRLGLDFVSNFLSDSRRIFREERLRYVIDDKGGVRFSADATFEAHVQATIKHLSHPEFKAAAAAYDACLSEMAGAPPDLKGAIRHIFEAVEILFKMLLPGVPRVGDAEIKQRLILLFNGSTLDKTAREASVKLANSLADWVNAAHFYRHGQVSDEPVQPPLALAVLLVDQGASFLRWLAELNVDQQNG